jgi:hypothetical protein
MAFLTPVSSSIGEFCSFLESDATISPLAGPRHDRDTDPLGRATRRIDSADI